MFLPRLVLAFLTAVANFGFLSGEEETSSKKLDNTPTSVDSRFFDLGGLINQIFPGFNQGYQPGVGRNPGGIDFPGNSQFYPGGAAIQNTPPPTPQIPINPATQWPIIDDAKHYPSQGHFGGGQPNLNNPGNFGYPQSQLPYPDGNYRPQYPNQVGPGFPQQPYPDQGGFNFPQRPNQQNFDNTNPNWGNVGYQPYPNDNAGFSPTPYPSDVNNGEYPSIPYPAESNYPNQGSFGGLPSSPFPNQGNYRGPEDYPNQGGFESPDNIGPGQESPRDDDGSNPEVSEPWNSDKRTDGESLDGNNRPQWPEQSQESEGGTNAILGRPVMVPETTTSAGQIVFPDSTESAADKQCVQDCQSSTEYDPVCGTNNVTYINPSKFICARNCGIHVFIKQRGRCPR